MGLRKKRTPKPKPKVVINYPPVPRKKWIPPDQRPKSRKPRFNYIKPKGMSQKISPSSFAKVWNQFYVYGDKTVLTGTFSQCHKRFPFLRNGRQGIANCAVACVFAHLFTMSTWTKQHIDSILLLGDNLHIKSLEKLGNRCLLDLPIEHLFNQFYINKKKINLSIKNNSQIIKYIPVSQDATITEKWTKLLDEFFQKNPSGIISVENQHIALWFSDKNYYFFAPDDYNYDATKWEGLAGKGVAIVVKCSNLNTLIPAILSCLKKCKNIAVKITPCSVESVYKINTKPPKNFTEIDHILREGTKLSKKEEPFEINSLYEGSSDISSLNVPTDIEKSTEESKVKLLSYYTEIVPEKMGILHSQICPIDPEVIKKQAIANALSALTMLRKYKSNVWIPKILDRILKGGNLMYEDSCKIAPQNEPLTLSLFKNKFAIEEAEYKPDFEEFAAIGKLQSQEPGILDLFPALESLLIANECCIIFGPTILAAWIEDGLFFMFDPNERDQQGKKIIRTKHIGSDIMVLDVPQGSACLTWFKDLKDLVALYFDNLEPNEKYDHFHIAKVQILDYVEPPCNYNNFFGLKSGLWILRGNYSQNSFIFPKRSRNFQNPAMTLIALTFNKIKKMKEFDEDTIDQILKLGDEFYNASAKSLEEKKLFKTRKLTINELNKHFSHGNLNFAFQIEDCFLNGIVNAKDKDETLNLKKGVNKFFENHNFGILTARNKTLAIWKENDIFYSFDSHNCDDNGFATTLGTACIIRALNLNDLTDIILANLKPESNDTFNITRVIIEFQENSEGIIKPALNYFTALNDNVAILRATLSIESQKYKLHKGKQAVPNCLVALGYKELCPTKLWSPQDLDEIIYKAQNLYVESVSKQLQELAKTQTEEPINPPAEESTSEDIEITSENVVNAFSLGLNKIEGGFEKLTEGNIQEKLQEAVQAAFEDKNEEKSILFESNSLTLCLWSKDNVYYLFDPYARDSYGKKDWSEYLSNSAEIDYLTKMPNEGAEGDFGESETFFGINSGVEKANFKDYAKDNDINDNKDPIENDANSIQESESSWPEEVNGVACVMWFTKLIDLIDHIMGNIPLDMRQEMNFKLIKVTLTNLTVLKKCHSKRDPKIDDTLQHWHNFDELECGKWILRGTINLEDKLFPKYNRGKQDFPVSWIALLKAYFYPTNMWTSSTVDQIISYGDKYLTSIKRLWKEKLLQETSLDPNEIDELLATRTLTLEDLQSKICFAKETFHLTLEQDVITGDITSENSGTVLSLSLADGLTKFFDKNQFGLLQAKGRAVAIWREDKAFYMLDGKACGPNGIKSVYGTSCTTRYQEVKSLSQTFLSNLQKMGSNAFYIHKVEVSKDNAVSAIKEKAMVPKLGGFHKIDSGKAILQGTIAITDSKFDKIAPNFQFNPIAIVALAMSLIHKVETWTRPIINEILNFGSKLYDDSLTSLGSKFNPWQDKLDIKRVNTKFNLGTTKINFKVVNFMHHGIINAKGSDLPNLRKGIEIFLNESTHGVIITEPLTLAIWKEDSLDSGHASIYLFDPYPRSPLGLPLRSGVACLMAFSTAKLAAQHIINCILDPEKRNGVYCIVPVDIFIEKITCEPLSKNDQSALAKKQSRIIAKLEKKAAKKDFKIGRHKFHVVSKDEAFIRGLFSQASNRFCEESRGLQDLPNCIVCLVMNQLRGIESWDHRAIDLVLETGDQLYIDSYLAFEPKNKKLGVENVLRKFYMQETQVNVTIYKPIARNAFTFKNVYSYLFSFFQEEQHCMISYLENWVAIMFKDGFYYLFDPQDLDLSGIKVPNGLGWAMVTRFTNIDLLAQRILINLASDSSDVVKKFSLWLLDVEL